ncbi:MAG: cytidine deaminase [Oscillospiraceae bacterium]|nr:cytidine deaminase [Oscillospiraceae bacterium]
MTHHELLALAANAAEKSYSPYSGFQVGAALLCESGNVYTGANIENAAYSPTVCAERTALFKAVLDGERDFRAIAVAALSGGGAACAPCGVCRQVLAEFCGGEFQVVMSGKNGGLTVMTLNKLLPMRFGRENLNQT